MGEAGKVVVGAARGQGGTAREIAGILLVLLTLVVVWGTSAVVLHLLLRTDWTVSLAAAPLLLMVALFVRNAVRGRRRWRPERST
jgi:RsiW-degrading membrane proteinase PrsW (M82 family)